MKRAFKSPWYQWNGHVQTIWPSIFRTIVLPYNRERLELEDGDFLDLDWLKSGSKKLLVVTHGLEGDSTRHYVTGLIRAFSNLGFDGLAWNCRSCSGEINRLPRFYHHGDAEDLKKVVRYAIQKGYTEIYLAGFSMGGSLSLRAVAEWQSKTPKELKAVMVASVPLDLVSSVAELAKKGKRFYMRRFLRKLHVKLEVKSKMFPDNPDLNVEGYRKRITDFYAFDSTYTAPLHGYKKAMDFYQKASVKPILGQIEIPGLVLQAQNDPFLTKECLDLGCENSNLKMIISANGGHVGFEQQSKKESFAEETFKQFVQNL